MSAVIQPPIHKKALQKPPTVKPTLIAEKFSILILAVAAVAGCALLFWMKVIEPRRTVAQIQLQNGGVQKISLGAFQERLLFERAREVVRQNRRGVSLPWYEHVVIDYRYLSSLGFAGGILDRMAKEIVLREEAVNRGLTASESEIDRVIEEEGARGKSPSGSPSQIAAVSTAQEVGPQSTVMLTSSLPREQTSATSVGGVSKPPNSLTSSVSKPSETRNTSCSKTVLGVARADLPANYRNIVRVGILEKKLKDTFYESTPKQLDQVRLRLIRFEVDTDARNNSQAASDPSAFDQLYVQVVKGAVRNASGMAREWSSARELTKDFSAELSKAIFRLRAGECLPQLTPAARGWYLAKLDGHEVRTATEEWRLARAEDAFNEWLAHQQTRITQLSLWMEHVPLMAGVPLNQESALSIPTGPWPQSVEGKNSFSPTPQAAGARNPTPAFYKMGNQNADTTGLFPSRNENGVPSRMHELKGTDPAFLFQQDGSRSAPGPAPLGVGEKIPGGPSPFDQPRQSQPAQP